MPTIKEEAQAYEPKTIKNITEIEVVRTDLIISDETFKDSDDKPFTVKVTEIDGEKYRIPVSVLKYLKSILEVKPELKTFQVKKSGTGLQTEYTVIPLE